MSYGQMEAAAIVFNIDDGLLKLEIFRLKRNEAFACIQSIITRYEEDGYVEERDKFRHQFFKDLLAHLQTLRE
jgi:hypothetical protein